MVWVTPRTVAEPFASTVSVRAVTVVPASVGMTEGVEADAASCTVTDLAGGMSYTVVVRAVNAVGSTDSEPADVYVPFNGANVWVGGVQITAENIDARMADMRAYWQNIDFDSLYIGYDTEDQAQ